MGSILRELTPGFESGKLTPPSEKGMNVIKLDQAIDAYAGKIKKPLIAFDE